MFTSKLLEKLNTFRCDGVLCDVVLNCSGDEFRAHRAVLAASCDYFQALFTTSMQERDCSVINLEVSSSIAHEILSFLYTGKVNLCAANCKEILIAADYLMLEDLKVQCEDYFESLLSVDTCVQSYADAMNYNCDQLILKSEKLVLKNFPSLKTTKEFIALEYPHLERILKNDDLVVEEEQEVFHVIIAWVEHAPAERLRLFATLFQYIRLCSIPLEFITGTIAKNRLVKQSDLCMSKIFQRIQMDLTEANNYNKMQRPRKCLQNEDQAIILLGGISCGKSLKDTLAYMPVCDEFITLKEMSVERDEHVVVVGNGVLYVIGGVKTPCRIDSFNPKTNAWASEVLLSERVLSSAGVFFNGKIILIGGRDGFQCVPTVQCYDTVAKTEETLPPLTAPRKAMCAVIIDEDLYVIGGCTYDNDSLNIVERLKLGNGNKWEKVASLLHRRKYACADVLPSGKLLVAGGFQDTNSVALQTCEVYNPECNVWFEVANLVVPRAVACMGRVNSYAYIVGGKSSRICTDTIEYYDEDANEWTLMDKRLPNACAWLQCGVMSLDLSNSHEMET